MTTFANGESAASVRTKINAAITTVDALGTMSTQSASSVAITGGTITGITDLAVTDGGTGISSYTIGDILYASASGVLSKLADVATGNALISGGVGVAPSYGKVGLTTHVSGTLPVANGGTNITSYAIGDILFASASGVLSALADVATGNALISGGVGVAPSYGKIGLTTHVSGTLAVGNGGTGAITLTGYVKGTGTTAMTASATIPNTDISGLGTMSTQAASAVAITGGTINGTTVGATTPAAVTGTPVASTSVVTSGFTTLAAGTLALAMASKGVVQVTPNATGTFTSTVPPAGTRTTLIVLTSGTTSYTMTFGTGFKTTGTLATGTVSARYFVFMFISDGTNLIECSRTVAIA